MNELKKLYIEQNDNKFKTEYIWKGTMLSEMSRLNLLVSCEEIIESFEEEIRDLEEYMRNLQEYE
ncbi:hypothetical protein KA005_09985 [bacterium]|nr:hypothetical protein [bacterium]